MSDPEPLQTFRALPGECPVMEADPGGVKHPNLLGPDGRVPGIDFEQGEILVGERSNLGRQATVVNPEVRVGKMIQSGVQRPAS